MPIDEDHPGFVVLEPDEKEAFSKLKNRRDDGSPLSPGQQQELDDLCMLIKPSVFGPELDARLKDL